MTDWKQHAVCVGRLPVFFDADTQANARAKRRMEMEAKQVCFGCPVRNNCLEYAIEFDEWGVWGATTRQERLVLQAQRDFDKQAQLIARTATVVPASDVEPSRSSWSEDWVVIEQRDSLLGADVKLTRNDDQQTWHGSAWRIFVDDLLKHDAVEESEAWMFFYSATLNC